MKIDKCAIDDVLIIELDRFEDNRGFFIERFNKEKFKEFGFSEDFVQDNHSRSHPNVLRGMHMQNNPEQGKLVGVIRGAIWDVIVDLRPNSKTFKKYFGINLTEDNGKMLWIPEGFAHGFIVTSNYEADVLYKVNAKYNSKGEISIKWDDQDLMIDWPIKNPIVSEKDNLAMSYKEFESKYL